MLCATAKQAMCSGGYKFCLVWLVLTIETTDKTGALFILIIRTDLNSHEYQCLMNP